MTAALRQPVRTLSLQQVPARRTMHTALWIAQGILAVLFLMAGGIKTFAFDRFAQKMDWARPMGRAKVAGIGLAELAGALGLVLPMALGIAEFLTPLAALGLAVVMVLGAAFHARRNEMPGVVPPVVVGALAAWVAWGRWSLLGA